MRVVCGAVLVLWDRGYWRMRGARFGGLMASTEPETAAFVIGDSGLLGSLS